MVLFFWNKGELWGVGTVGGCSNFLLEQGGTIGGCSTFLLEQGDL